MHSLEELEPSYSGGSDDVSMDEGVPCDNDNGDIVMFLLEELKNIVFSNGDTKKNHGGSASGREANVERDFDDALFCLKKFYFGVDGNPVRYNEATFARQ